MGDGIQKCHHGAGERLTGDRHLPSGWKPESDPQGPYCGRGDEKQLEEEIFSHRLFGQMILGRKGQGKQLWDEQSNWSVNTTREAGILGRFMDCYCVAKYPKT